jgi:hypothetical protein
VPSSAETLEIEQERGEDGFDAEFRVERGAGLDADVAEGEDLVLLKDGLEE